MSTHPDPHSLDHSTADCDALRQLLPAYVIGATTPEEAEQVEQLLPLCPDAQEDLKFYARMADGMSASVEAVAPPAHVRQALLDRVAAEAAAQKTQPPNKAPRVMPGQRNRQLAWGAAAAVIILLLVTNAYWVLRTNTIQQSVADLQQEKQTILEMLNAERLQRITLQSTITAEALARLFWNSDSRGATFYTDRLPTLDENHIYQVWLIGNDQPLSVGTFDLNEAGQGLLNFTPEQDLDTFSAVAISVEPLGGSSAPTTDPLAVGEINQG